MPWEALSPNKKEGGGGMGSLQSMPSDCRADDVTVSFAACSEAFRVLYIETVSTGRNSLIHLKPRSNRG